MANRFRDNKPRGLKPVKRIELSEQNAKRRLIVVVVLIIIGATAIAFGVGSLLSTEPGWQQIEANPDGLSCARDFVFNYYFADEEISATAESKALTAYYSRLCVDAYKLFNRYEGFDGINNVYYINEHVNEEIRVDSALYEAFSTVLEGGNRYLYFGAINAEYEYNFFGTEDSPQSEEFDPYENKEMADYFATLARYAMDEGHVRLELLGGNTVKLFVSKEYQDLAKENEISVFIDFYRLKNAFIVDFFADSLKKKGYDKGSISSYDGYVRCLDTRDEIYAINLFDKREDEVYNAAKIAYRGPMSLVNLRAFPMGENDSFYFYIRGDGRVITPYVDDNGLYKTSTQSMVGYSEDKSCAQVAISLLDVFVADSLDTDVLSELEKQGISSVWFEDLEICRSNMGLIVTDLYNDEKVKYTLKYNH